MLSPVYRLSPLEWRASIGLAGLSGLRMLGLFIILPVFALFAEHLPGGHDLTLVGIALGAYGLTQALLQIPFGWLSDRLGRKPVIYGGLALFALGSFVAASAQHIHMVIVGRIIQGAGAISAAVMALTADLTRDEVRTKAMALIGSTIGATFALSLVVGPVLNRLIGVPGIFAMIGVLALAAMTVVYGVIPEPRSGSERADTIKSAQFTLVLQDAQLLRLNFGIFVLHACLMAIFVVIPFNLQQAGLDLDHHWRVYLPVMVGSFLMMLPAILYADRQGAIKPVFVVAVLLLLAALLFMGEMGPGLKNIIVSLLIFFTAFNALEASLPSLVSKMAPPGSRGTALGVYSSVQFLGTFAGAAMSGYLAQHYGHHAVFVASAALCVLWLAVAVTMQAPQAILTRIYSLPSLDRMAAHGLSRQLATLPGVVEALIPEGEGVAYLKVVNPDFDERRVLQLIGEVK
jgi:MFS family permease